MTKRRLLIIALALVAIAAAVPVVPWAIVEWHVREIAADRQAFLEALEAPEGSWEWRAVEEYATRPAGEEALRMELAIRSLLPSRAWTADNEPSTISQDVFTAEIELIREMTATWSVRGFAEEHYLLVVGVMREPRVWATGSRSGEVYMEKGLWPLKDWYNGDLRRRIQALRHVVRPSSIALPIHPELAVHLLRLGDPMIPSEARKWAEDKGSDDPETLVVFAKLREPDGEATVDATGSAESDSSP